MTPHKQLYLHEPENGTWGDCQRTVIACMLDMRPEDVPHLNRKVDYEGEQQDHFRSWLADRELALVSFAFQLDPEDVLIFMSKFNPGVHYMLSGYSRTGCNHVVIALDDKIVHDPSLTDAGIVGRCDNDHTYVEFIVRK